MISNEEIPLTNFGKNIYSQNGEDGLILEILERIRSTSDKSNSNAVKWACDVGAWDGIHLSNTYNLVSSQGFGCVSIECDKKKYLQLSNNLEKFNNQYLVNELVGLNQDNNLDILLSKTPIPKNFEVLSIDVDGMDYHLWQSLSNYNPKVVVIEYNPTIPNMVKYIQPKNPEIKHGSSANALIELGSEKNYVAVVATHSNLIFVNKTLAAIASLPTQVSINELIPNSIYTPIYVFQGYEGEIIFSQPIDNLNWHGTKIELSIIKPLPKLLQKYINDYNLIERIIFSLHSNVKKHGVIGIQKSLNEMVNQMLGTFVARLNPKQRRLLKQIKNVFNR